MVCDISDLEDIRILVDAFYKRAGEDDLLGPIFSGIEDSIAHKESLYNYWAHALLQEATDRREPFPHHIESMFSRQHFIRWLGLFLETIDSHYAGARAEKAKVIVIKKSEEFQSRLQLFRF